jgi:RNA polymerase sigma-70 factor (ECF subfamily)
MTTTFRVPAQPHSDTKAAGPDDSAHATCSDDGLAAFLGVRPRLFGLAYRMTGNVTEAEDIVQETWLRWQTTDRIQVRNPAAFLIAAATRLAINLLQSACSRREICVDTWLPEPVDTNADPHVGTERDEALNIAVRLLLERLSPTQRAAYVLREAFSYPYRHIAGVLQVEPACARQLVARARDHVTWRHRGAVNPAAQRRLLNAFVTAARTGDLTRLEHLFAADVSNTAAALTRANPVTTPRSMRSMLR